MNVIIALYKVEELELTLVGSRLGIIFMGRKFDVSLWPTRPDNSTPVLSIFALVVVPLLINKGRLLLVSIFYLIL